MAKAEQWFPGKQVDGVSEIFHDPGDGSTKSSGYGVCGNEIVKPGNFIVTHDDGRRVVLCEAPEQEQDR